MINETNKDMTDYSHLTALETRLTIEKNLLSKTNNEFEKECRQVWVNGIEKEIREERQHLGLSEYDNMSDDELLNELGI